MATNIRSVLRDHLVNTASVSSVTSTRIYSDQAPDQDRSADHIVFTLDDTRRERFFGNVTTLARSELTVYCWSTNAIQAYDLLQAVRNEIDHYRGTLGNTITVDCRGIFVEDDGIERQRNESGEEYGPYQAYALITVWWIES